MPRTPDPTTPGHRRLARRWLATALAFPPSGLLAIELVGAVDAPVTALAGGAIVGAGIGAAQWLALRPFVPAGRPLAVGWIGATTVAMAVGLLAGAAAVGYGTSTADLVTMGLVTGAVLGPAQALVLRRARLATGRRALGWAAAVPVLWGLGWFVTSSAGVDVERQYSVFGLLGALSAAAVGALVIAQVVRPVGTVGSRAAAVGASPST